MAWLSTQSGEPTVFGQVDAILEIMRDEEMNADFMTVFDKLSERISGHLSSGSNGEALRLTMLVQNHIKAMPEGYWRDRYEKTLEERFGHLVKSGSRAKLGMVSDD
jgi:hypothetical protein